MIDTATVLVYAGGYLSIVFLSVCLAAGLYYIAELIEEYTLLTKRIVTWISEGTLLVHALLLFWDRLPLLPVCTSAGAHIAYLQLLKRFPFFRLSSWEGVSSILLLVAANVGWGRYFWHTWHSLEYIFGFLLMTTWLNPILLILSLAANEQTLPGGGGEPYGSSGSGQPKGKASRGLVLSLVAWLKHKRDDVLPGVDRMNGRARLKPHTV